MSDRGRWLVALILLGVAASLLWNLSSRVAGDDRPLPDRAALAARASLVEQAEQGPPDSEESPTGNQPPYGRSGGPRSAAGQAESNLPESQPGPSRVLSLFAPPGAVSSGRTISRDSLAVRISKLLERDNLKSAVVALVVTSVTHGGIVYERFADRPLIVASNAKLLTSAAALTFLGPEYRFETQVFAGASIDSDGRMDGDLLVKGSGDPDLMDDHRPAKDHLLPRLVALVRDSGVRRITGRLVIDDHVFDRQYVPSTWRKSELKSPYNAPVGGFSLFENCVTVHVRPGEATGLPGRASLNGQSGVFQVLSKVKTISKGSPKLSLAGPRADEPVNPGPLTVRGTMPVNSKLYRLVVPVREPVEVAGRLLKQALLHAGIVIEGELVLADRPLAVSDQLLRLGSVSSRLIDALNEMNKESSNVISEHLYKLSGWVDSGKGSFEAGGQAVLAVLKRFGIDTMGANSADGSGISRENRFTARQISELLASLYRGPLRDPLLRSLPESGVDGTLRKRLGEPAYRGRLRGKTGWIDRVSSLSGYCQTRHGELLAFSMLFNGYTGRNQYIKPIQDSIAKLLIDLEPAPPASPVPKEDG